MEHKMRLFKKANRDFNKGMKTDLKNIYSMSIKEKGKEYEKKRKFTEFQKEEQRKEKRNQKKWLDQS